MRIILTIAVILPIAPLLNRIVFRPIADASVLLLLIVSVALHFALDGLGLLFFGPEGVRTESLIDYTAIIAGTPISGQAMLIIVASAIFFSFLLFLFFNFTLYGKALHATAINRTGARLMGIRPHYSGTIAFLLGSLLAAVSGILIAPVNTIFYDSGFLIGLKSFVGAIIGGLVSFPVTAIGSLFVGILESFAAFLSSPFKEVIVFSILIPVLLWRSYTLVQARGRGRGMSARQTLDCDHGRPCWRLPAAPLYLQPFTITLLNYIGVYAFIALGLVLLTGIGGMVSFGQASFMGIAAYATAWTSASWAIRPGSGLFSRWSMTGLVAAILGAVTLRLQGHFLSLSTIAWGLAIYFSFGNIPGLGAYNGIAVVAADLHRLASHWSKAARFTT